MNEFLWIMLGLFGCIGIVQCVGGLMTLRKRPKDLRPGYYVLLLYDDPARIEARLRYELARLSWNITAERVLLLVDTGLGEESAAVCDRFVRENPGLFYCTSMSLVDTLRNLDQLYST